MSETSTDFTISAEMLSEMFILDNIQSKRSILLLKEFGGVSGLCKILNSDAEFGISSTLPEIYERRKQFGQNLSHTRERDTVFHIMWRALQDFVLQLLIVAAIISLIIGTVQDPVEGWYEGVAIFITVGICLSVTTINDYMKDGQFVKLYEQTNLHTVIVTRDSFQQEISAQELLVGDIMSVNPGEIFPVDGVLVKGNFLSVDESSITGESALVKKKTFKNDEENECPFLVSGGKVSEGSGMMIVCAVGENCVLEKHRLISGDIKSDEETPLQERLKRFATSISQIAFVGGAILTAVLITHLSVSAAEKEDWGNVEWEGVITSIILGITIIVVSIPDGLPLALTLAMTYSIFRMKDEHIFVRHLKGCEIMGAATNVLSDKTGTLTQNKMKVTAAVLYDQEFVNIEKVTLSDEQKEKIGEIIARNTTAFINKSGKNIGVIGNKTEGALLELIDSWDLDYHKFRDHDLQYEQFAFNSSSKRMTTIYKKSSTTLLVYSKGAAENILDFCPYYLSSDGVPKELTSEKRKKIQDKINSYSSSTLRVIGLATGVHSKEAEENSEISQIEYEKNLQFVGLLGIQDPLRPEAKEAVEKVQKAGLTVRMVTGDNLETAISIAKKCSILPEGLSDSALDKYVITGKVFRKQVGGLITEKSSNGKISAFKVGDIEKFKEIIQKLRVIARCSPEDKLLLVVGLKALGEVVAVTGDGSNDAAALKQSDIGLAMMSGTQLAKESSDIILLDDNFYSVLNSVKWGRNVYESTRKFLQFQVTCNIVALVVCIAGGIIVENSPLSAVQMLWVNLIMDSFAALALATEPAKPNLLESKPFGRSESIVTFDMLISMASQAIYQIIILLIILFVGPYMFGVESGWNNHDDNETDWDEENGKHFTIFFNTFVMLQIFNEINCRKLALSEVNIFEGFFNNWIFIVILIITFVIQILLVEYGGEPMRCTQLEVKFHFICVCIGLSSILVGVLVRALVTKYRMHQKSKYFEENEPVFESFPLITN